MTIAVGDRLPSANLLVKGDAGFEEVDIAEYVAGRKVVIFALPGAFTATCSAAHVPSFIRTADAFREKGIDEIICIAANDPAVMAAWGEATGATAAGITMLADWSSAFGEAIGLTYDAPASGLVKRIRRSAMVVNDGVVEVLRIEEKRGTCELTSGEALLELL